MTLFDRLWDAHPGRDTVCDTEHFANQCAMRVGHAMMACDVELPWRRLRTCRTQYSAFGDHQRCHVLGAQNMADAVEADHDRIGCAPRARLDGTIMDNRERLTGKAGIVFILNGWEGGTDHVDLFRGDVGRLVGGVNGGPDDYRIRGEQVWFWEMASDRLRAAPESGIEGGTVTGKDKPPKAASTDPKPVAKSTGRPSERPGAYAGKHDREAPAEYW